MNLGPDVDLRSIADLTENASGADLRAIVTEAGMSAIREERTQVLQRDFERAIARVLQADTHGACEEPDLPNYA
jgi:Proteasome-activating nucleotidase